MSCHKCGLTWDMNDPDRPQCKQKTVEKQQKKRLIRPKVKHEYDKFLARAFDYSTGFPLC